MSFVKIMAGKTTNMNNYMLYFRRYLPIAIILTCFLILYNHVIFNMVQDWSVDDNYSHGFLIPFISIFLIWQKKGKLAVIPIKPSNYGLILLGASLLLLFVSNIGAELFTMRVSMLMVILSLSVFITGWKFSKALCLPVAYLLFMIPFPAIIWNKIAFPLKLFATQMAVSFIKILNIPVYAEGNIIHLSNTTLEVVDACSGLRSLTSLLALSAAFALISQHSKLEKFFLFLSAIPIAIFMNIIRLSVTAILARQYGSRIAEGFLHDFSGILVFFIAIILIYIIHSLLRWCHALRS